MEELKVALTKVKPFVKKRIFEFERLLREGETEFDFRPFLNLKFKTDLFSELCFCILTANSSATLGLKIQARLSDGKFWKLTYEELSKELKSMGHRYYEQRARRIVEARKKFKEVEKLLKFEREPKKLRELLSNKISPFKVKGFGYKEASHFLRNVGFKDVAIIDRHVLRFLVERGLVENKTLTKNFYLHCEEKLRKIADELSLSLAELDLYIFYLKTGKVLK